MDELRDNDSYNSWLSKVKKQVSVIQQKTALAANYELVLLYWFLGYQIVEKQKVANWGSSFIDVFSKDLKKAFPDLSGFSSKNLRYCRAFYNFYSDSQKWQQLVAKTASKECLNKWQQPVAKKEIFQEYAPFPALTGQIPWGHNIQIFSKSESLEQALFYITQTITNGWSRNVLALQIKSELYQRHGQAVTNFESTLPAEQSDLAIQTIKDPYVFDFLTMTKPYNERDIESSLIEHVSKFLLELGKGFAFVGRQYQLSLAGNDYYLDLLFYHVKLKCYVVVELKNTKFVPEFAGKLNFYLSAVDDLLKSDDDKPTIGILLCRDKNRIETEFSLRGMSQPMGVSDFSFTELIPEELKSSLPTLEEIEADVATLNNNQED